MNSDRVLMIGLDAFEISFADEMMNRGELSHLKKIRDRSARYLLDHGPDKFSGLTWEHVSGGVSPSDGSRWSAVHFDVQEYTATQHSTSAVPFFAGINVPTVVFDVPYCDLTKAPSAQGVVNWGSHDPGVDHMARPAEIAEEIAQKFGPYPAENSIYGFCWPSVERTKRLSDELIAAVALRAKVARWLFSERLPNWKLGIMVVSEAHSGTEPLWHGADRTHPLHGLPSAKPAKEGLENIYRAIDSLVGELSEAFPDASIVLFSMHGMGRNEADIAAMILLPELLYRHHFGGPYAREVAWPGRLADGTPLLDEDANWEWAMEAAVPHVMNAAPAKERPFWKKLFGFKYSPPHEKKSGEGTPLAIDWMPASRYRKFWPEMEAFALPSFYDGRVRINLRGREAKGIVPLRDYKAVCEKIAGVIRGCTNSQTGEAVIEDIVFPAKDPMTLNTADADFSVIFRTAPVGMAHPQLGTIGPYPWRRTGGHTGETGFLYLAGKNISSGDRGVRSSFDVVPTVIDLLGGDSAAVSGTSILDKKTSQLHAAALA